MINIGTLVNTHGIKGEARIMSNSDFKDLRFKVGAILTIEKKEYEIENSFNHKQFIVVKLKDINSINDVLPLKGKKIFAKKLVEKDLGDDEYFNEDLINCIVINQDNINRGKVVDVIVGGIYNMIRVKFNDIKYLVPFHNDFITQVDMKNKKIYIDEIKGLINEN